MHRAIRVAIACLTAACLPQDMAVALPPEPAEGLLPWLPRGNDWLATEYVYTGEVFTNTRGGLDTNEATAYRGNFDLFLTADLDRLGCPLGGTFFLYAQNGHGPGISRRYVGDVQVLSNIEDRDLMQVSEYWWYREWLDGRLAVRLGKRDANEEFAAVEMGADFINSSFGLHPTIPMPTFPDPSAAAIVLFRPTDWLAFHVGVWDGDPYGGNWGFSGEGVTFSIYEMQLHYELLGTLPGSAHAGLWYHSDRWENLADAEAAAFDGNHGFHAEMEQMLWREQPGDEENPQGLGLFAQYAWAPQDRNEITQYLGGGLLYRGPIPGFDDDLLGIGVAHILLSGALPELSYETAIELFYKAQVSEHIALQPDVQFIANPGGNGRDSLVVGLRFEAVL